MDEPDLFRGFRSGVTAPSADAERRAFAELTHAIERRHGRGTRVLRLIWGRPGRTALPFAAVAIVAAAALFVSSPWTTSPGFLEQVHAALTPPAGTILHLRWEETTTSTDPACTVTHGPNEIWTDQTPPHRYRVLLWHDIPHQLGPPDAPSLDCSPGTRSELGGTFDTGETLTFVAPNTLDANLLMFRYPVDPVKRLREAISAGRAHDEGETQLDGRTVKRIRLDPPRVCPVRQCLREPGYAYVDPETLYPIQLEGPVLRGRLADVRAHLVVRTLTYEYLPRTAANLALTDIRAQHPDATGP